MAVDRKYGRVELEHGDIGEDEPVFVFRAQDALAVRVLAYYASLCIEAGSPDGHVTGIGTAADEFEAWQAEHRTQVPQSTPRS